MSRSTSSTSMYFSGDFKTTELRKYHALKRCLSSPGTAGMKKRLSHKGSLFFYFEFSGGVYSQMHCIKRVLVELFSVVIFG
jgi:hypothetical protein